MDIRILKGVISKNHVHLYISHTPKVSISDLVKRLNGKSAQLMLEGKLVTVITPRVIHLIPKKIGENNRR